MTGLSVEASGLVASLRNLAFCAEKTHQVDPESAQVCLASDFPVTRHPRRRQVSCCAGRVATSTDILRSAGSFRSSLPALDLAAAKALSTAANSAGGST